MPPESPFARSAMSSSPAAPLSLSLSLSAVLSGHSADVRCLASLPASASHACAAALASGSRDLLAKVWRTRPETKDLEWTEERTFERHDRYVTALASAAPTDAFPEGLVYSGTAGGAIRWVGLGVAEPQ